MGKPHVNAPILAISIVFTFCYPVILCQPVSTALMLHAQASGSTLLSGFPEITLQDQEEGCLLLTDNHCKRQAAETLTSLRQDE